MLHVKPQQASRAEQAGDDVEQEGKDLEEHRGGSCEVVG
jgi:hypothetical protein